MSVPHFQARPIKAGEDSLKNWREINRQGSALEGANAGLAKVQSELAARRTFAPGQFSHPFAIYVYPVSLRTSPSADDWRKVRVRSGLVFVDWVEATLTGSDGIEPDAGELGTVGDITCDASTPKYWLWIEITGSTAAIQHSATAPTWSTTKIPIGYVDTNTYASQYRVRIRQIINTDIFTCS